MISTNGWNKFWHWNHSASVRELYTKRCRLEAEEMTCAAQAAELLAPCVAPGDQLLDAGCGSGYLFHSLVSQKIPVEYWGIDACESLIEIGRSILPDYGLASERLLHGRIEDLDGMVDHAVCMNVLSNIDNYHRPLERLLLMSRKTVILRESVNETSSYCYVRDKYLDKGVDLKVYVNTYPQTEFIDFIRSYGFEVESVVDRRTNGRPEMVIDYPHYWKFFLATRRPVS